MTDTIKDADKGHWTYRAPKNLRPYLQLARYDRPVGYWLLALPGWIGLAFASLSHGFAATDLKWAALILIGAIAMRGAGCTYNDIVDRDLDAQVDRTALRPLPAGTITPQQAWIWLFIQCAIGLIVLLCLPRLAQIISLCSIPLVAAYPFMKRITWWPQVWLGMTFNWAVLVAYAAKTGTLSPAVLVLYAGLIFWTIGYDTIYACQDIEDDAMVGIKSTARRFGKHVRLGVGLCYAASIWLITYAISVTGRYINLPCGQYTYDAWEWGDSPRFIFFENWLIWYLLSVSVLFALHLVVQVCLFSKSNKNRNLKIFKSNKWAALFLIFMICFYHLIFPSLELDSMPCMDLLDNPALFNDLYTPITSL